MWEEKKLSKLQEKLNIMKEGGGAEKQEAQHKKGKLTARERIDYLFDK